MQMEQEERIVLSNVDNGQDFKILNNAKMFAILSSGIYENPIRAIIRELSCNAWDSHVEADKRDEPFRVKLPSRFDPILEVEDYGIGLGHEDVINLYTSYGDSTKMGSNEVIGALGLGSKTPFSYTETFTVRSRKDGIENWYNAYIGESGFPTISRTSTHETNDANGVMIQMPVKDEDCSKFRDEAIWVFQSFQLIPDGLPDSVTNTVSNISQAMYSQFSERGFYIKRSHQFNFYALMGSIQYRLPIDMMREHFSYELEYIKLRHGFSNIVLPFDIGELSIAASRESLNFTETESDNTFRAIKDKIKNTISVEIDELQKEISACDDWVDAINYVIDNGLKTVAELFQYNGKNVNNLMAQSINLRTAILSNVHWDDTNYCRMNIYPYDHRVFLYGKSTDRLNYTRETYAKMNVCILYNDTGKRHLVPTVAREYAKESGNNMVLCLMEPISKKHMRRLKAMHPKMTVEPISPYVEAYKEERATHKTPVAKYQGMNEIKARSIIHGCVAPLNKHDIEKLRNDGLKIAFYDARNKDVAKGMIKLRALNGAFSYNHFSHRMMHYLDVDIILIGNKTNIKRMHSNQIKNIDDIFDSKVDNLKSLCWADEVIESPAVVDIDDDPKVKVSRYLYSNTGYYYDSINTMIDYLEEKGMISFKKDATIDRCAREAYIVTCWFGRKIKSSSSAKTSMASNYQRAHMFLSDCRPILQYLEHGKTIPDALDMGIEKDADAIAGYMKKVPLLEAFAHDDYLDDEMKEDLIHLIDLRLTQSQ